MAYDAGLAERMCDVVARLGGRVIREKNVFGGRGFLVGTSAFLIVWEQGIIVKLAADEYPVALGMPGVTPFAPMGERPMSTWVVVEAEQVADDPELLEWAERGLRGIASGPSKRPRKRR